MENVVTPHSSVSLDLSTKHVITGGVKVYSHEQGIDQLDAMRIAAEHEMVAILAFAKSHGAQP